MNVSRKDVLNWIAFQSSLLALSAAIGRPGAIADRSSETAAAELRHLAQAAKRTAGWIERSAPGSPQG